MSPSRGPAGRRTRRLLASVAACLLGLPAAAQARTVIRDGPARFEVLTPTLIRVEYANDQRFENQATMTAVRSRLPMVSVATHVVRGWRVISTRRLTLRYRLGSGPFDAHNLVLRFVVGGRRMTVHPGVGGSTANLGGWRRALDLLSGPVSLHDGLLSRAGWYVLDDTSTVLLSGRSPGFRVRPFHRGAYQDKYLFAYGRSYTTALSDLRALTGPAPLLPRSAFGVWFSRYWPYSEQDYHALLGQFRTERIPLDTLSIDTDFKRESDPAGAALAAAVVGAPGRPYSWDGWEWNPTLFPDPHRFLDWAHSQGLSVTVNIHPSISSHDPQWHATQVRAGGLASTSSSQCRILLADPTAVCGLFNWTSPRALDAYFALHQPFERAGVDFFWLDWCCDSSSAVAPGLTADTWINSLYARRERARGLRWLAFARVGGAYQPSAPNDGDGIDGGNGIFAEHRDAIQFTGDTCATWSMLAFEARFTAEEGNLGLPYVSHDIGSFNGQPANGQCSSLGTPVLNEHLPDELYARWVAFGTFQPLDRLHSNHGDRLPWQYNRAAGAAAASFLRLREALNPYVYTLARRAYDTGLPIAGALYLQWPGLSAAYDHPSEYTFGSDMVVAPVTAPGDPAPASVWIPPGAWVDYFTGRRYAGPAVRNLSVPLSQMPVLVRAGSVIPTRPAAPFTPASPASRLVLTAYPGAHGSFSLYDDQGVGFGYTHRRYTRTDISHVQRGRRSTLTIGPAQGRFRGAPRLRSWQVRFLGVARPRRVRVNGRAQPLVPAGAARGWSYDLASRTLTVNTGTTGAIRPVTITAD